FRGVRGAARRTLSALGLATEIERGVLLAAADDERGIREFQAARLFRDFEADEAARFVSLGDLTGFELGFAAGERARVGVALSVRELAVKRIDGNLSVRRA